MLINDISRKKYVYLKQSYCFISLNIVLFKEQLSVIV